MSNYRYDLQYDDCLVAGSAGCSLCILLGHESESPSAWLAGHQKVVTPRLDSHLVIYYPPHCAPLNSFFVFIHKHTVFFEPHKVALADRRVLGRLGSVLLRVRPYQRDTMDWIATPRAIAETRRQAFKELCHECSSSKYARLLIHDL